MAGITETLARWMEAGGRTIGQIRLARSSGGFTLCHTADEQRADLADSSGAEAARDLAHFDDAGKFRPLKTAFDLRHGWRLQLGDLAALRTALDYFYPAMTGIWQSWTAGTLQSVPLRETLGRQTGMYRVTQKITDTQAEALVAGFCAGCLKQRLWTLNGRQETAIPDTPESFPLLCHEACNLLVGKAREVVKQSTPPA